jgi:S-methylmethionine-dependent homocysteine/selenocysteine methylase
VQANRAAVQAAGGEHRRLRDGYAQQMELLAGEGVDLIALEMVDHPRYAEPAVEAALAAGLPVWLGLCVHADERDRGDGHAASITLEHRQVVRLAQGNAFDAVCVMHTDVDDVDAVLDLVSESWDGPVGPIPITGSGSGRAGGSSISPLSGWSGWRVTGAPPG